MKILIIRLTSMGDMIQVFPAITDIIANYPNASIDWLCDGQFKEIPKIHPYIKKVFSIELRKIKKRQNIIKNMIKIKSVIDEIKKQKYTHIIDIQSMFTKSGFLIPFMKSKSYGFDFYCSTDKLNPLVLDFRYNTQHKAKKINLTIQSKMLASFACNYTYQKKINYGLSTLSKNKKDSKTIIIHMGTTWKTKFWPFSHWLTLIELLLSKNYQVKLSWFGKEELNSCLKIKKKFPSVVLMVNENSKEYMPSSVSEKISEIINCKALISVDTGIAHLASALHTKTIILYGPSPYKFCAALGKNTIHIRSSFKCNIKCKAKLCVINKKYAQCMNQINVDTVYTKIVEKTK